MGLGKKGAGSLMIKIEIVLIFLLILLVLFTARSNFIQGYVVSENSENFEESGKLVQKNLLHPIESLIKGESTLYIGDEDKP